jgi:filamentous hemagglutinin family protein
MQQDFHQFLLAGSIILCGLVSSRPVLAQQVIQDNTLPVPTAVDAANNITGGTPSGANLFHSFTEFSIPSGGIATFVNDDLSIQNVIARVTGSSVSTIDGTIASGGISPNFSLFLINPNGIIFGQNASLSLGGSFIGSTASAIRFADGTQFSATSPAAPILTSSIPSSLVFSGSAAPIINRSQDNTVQNSVGSPAGLRVPNGQTLALVGGDLILEQGNLTADGGRIELGSVAGTGEVSLTSIANSNWQLGYAGIQTPNAAGNLFGSIQLSQGSLVDASDHNSLTGAGAINVQANSLTVESSAIFSTTFGAEPGKELTVNASTIQLKGLADIGVGGLFTQTAGTGAAGNAVVNTKQLTVQEGAQIATSAYDGNGNSGNLLVNASEFIKLSDPNSGLFTNVLAPATGNGGSLTITTAKLQIDRQAQINASTQSTGNAGNVNIRATDSIVITGIMPKDEFTGIYAQAEKGATGAPGTLTIATNKLVLQNGAFVSVGSASSYPGTINITASQIQIRGGSIISADAIGQGTGGNINITTDTIVGIDDGDIGAGSDFNRGGKVTINARGIFGLQERRTYTPENDIRVDSSLGIQLDGQVILNTPDIDPLRGLVDQPKLAENNKVAQGCEAQGGQASKSNSFVNTGTGGLPATPSAPFSSIAVWEDMRSHSSSPASNIAASGVIPSKTNPQNPIVEAQGWVLKPGSKDTVILTVNAPQVTPDTVSQTTFCHGNRS